MKDHFEDVPAWGNAACLLNENGINFDTIIVDQISKRDPYSAIEKKSDGIFHHFMLGNREVAQWSFTFQRITVFNPPRLWADQFIEACRWVSDNGPRFKA
jgi:hypothetical protein